MLSRLYVLLPLACATVIIMSCVNSNSQRKSRIASTIKSTEISTNGSFEPVAVLELFTSQGCSSCPPADALLGKTIEEAKKNGKNVYALSFHVDYWNRLGWTDPFSNNIYSQRQNSYVKAMGLNGAYTPQLVVNGKYEFVGSDASALSKALNKALNNKAEASFINLKAVKSAESISISYDITGDYNNDYINFALVSASETTQVMRGENGGRTLTNENVVLSFKTISPSASGKVIFNNKDKSENLFVVAYFQQKNNLEIKGAAKTNVGVKP